MAAAPFAPAGTARRAGLALFLALAATGPAAGAWDWGNWPWSEPAAPALPPPAAPAGTPPAARAPKPKPPPVRPYRVPTIEGKDVDFRQPLPPMEPVVEVDADAIFQTIRDCFPAYVTWGVEVDAVAGARFAEDGLFLTTTSGGTDQAALSRYYVGVVARMPLYSAAEVNRERAEELSRRRNIAATIQTLVKGLSDRRRAQREVGYFAALEARSRTRMALGIAESSEQIGFGRDYLAALNRLDEAKATIDGARIALVGQCRDEVRPVVNDYLKAVTR